jgi:hypothetical protein
MSRGGRSTLLRVGGVFVVTGLTLALALGPMFAVVGGVLMTCGGIMLALAMESVLAQEDLDAEVSTGPTVNRFHSRDDRVPRTP